MSGNPYENSTTPGDLAGRSSRTNTSNVAKIAAVIGLLALLLMLLIPARRSAREPARRNGCINSLRQIAIAILNYEAENGTLPPAYTVDENENRLHSWRALILPYMEEQNLYDSIDFSKPWDDPANEAARNAYVGQYMCPSSTCEDQLTTYCAVIGEVCAFQGATPRKLSEILDSLDHTMMLIEVDSNSAVHWMSPYDADVAVVMRLSPDDETNHSDIFNATFVNGRVRTLPLDLSDADRTAIMTIAGDDKPTHNDFSR